MFLGQKCLFVLYMFAFFVQPNHFLYNFGCTFWAVFFQPICTTIGVLTSTLN